MIAVDWYTVAILTFLVCFVAAMLLLGGFAIAVFRGTRDERRQRGNSIT